MSHKVIVAHPGRQHSFRTAAALKNNNMLACYVTTIYDHNSSLLMKALKKILPRDASERAAGRKCSELQDSDVHCFCEISGLLEILLSRIDKKRIVYRWWHNHTADRFGKKVASLAIKEKVDAVIMYDTTALKCFEILEEQAPNIVRILDCSAANRLYMKTVYENDMDISPEHKGRLLKERGHLFNKKYCLGLKREIDATEVFLAPSNFVKDSLTYSGVKEDKIVVCPYGANFKPEKAIEKNRGEGPLELVYVGNVTAMKGVHYLFKAVDMLGEKVHLTVVGAYDNSDHWLDPYIKTYDFVGRVPHEKVRDYLKKADVFVFPSLGEGLSLSVLEAMSYGLPCIVSENSGANDAILNGINGFIVKPQSINEIQKRILWCCENREKLVQMGVEAQKTSVNYSWGNYEKRLSGIIDDCLANKKKESGLTIYSYKELEIVHELELKALREIIRICDLLNIDYFLIDGAAIGAVRHHGFIPWDDDIDVGMLREDYRRFLKEAPKLLSKQYYLQTPYDGNKNPYFYSKLRINGTEFVEYCNRKLDIHHGVYVDICPFDEVPDNEKSNKKQFNRSQLLIRLFVLRQSPELSRAPNTAKRRALARVRFILHHLMRLVPYHTLSAAIENETTKYNGSEQSAYAFLHYPKRNTDYMLKKELMPLQECEFENLKVKIPFNSDAYLRGIMGNI